MSDVGPGRGRAPLLQSDGERGFGDGRTRQRAERSIVHRRARIDPPALARRRIDRGRLRGRRRGPRGHAAQALHRDHHRARRATRRHAPHSDQHGNREGGRAVAGRGRARGRHARPPSVRRRGATEDLPRRPRGQQHPPHLGVRGCARGCAPTGERHGPGLPRFPARVFAERRGGVDSADRRADRRPYPAAEEAALGAMPSTLPNARRTAPRHR